MRAIGLIGVLAPMLIPTALQAQAWTALVPQPHATEWKPISQRERFAFYAKSSFSLGTLASASGAAAASQVLGRPEEWREGVAGFGQRTGNNLAKAAIRDGLRYGISAALNEDPRYIASGHSNAGARIWYAASQTFAAHDGKGHRRFAVSKFVANAGASALSRYWAPSSWQGGKAIARDFAITSLMQLSFNLTREFGPDIIRRIKR